MASDSSSYKESSQSNDGLHSYVEERISFPLAIIPDNCSVEGDCSFVILAPGHVFQDGTYNVKFGNYGTCEAKGYGGNYLRGSNNIPCATRRGTHSVTVKVCDDTDKIIGVIQFDYQDNDADINVRNLSIQEPSKKSSGESDPRNDPHQWTKKSSSDLKDDERPNKEIKTCPVDMPMLMYLCDEMAKRGDVHFFRGLTKLGIMALVLEHRSEYYEDFAVTARKYGSDALAEIIAMSSRDTLTIEKLVDAIETERSLAKSDLDAVNDDYNTNSVQNSNSSDDAQLHDETVDNVEQTDMETGRITDYKITSAEQLLILGRSCQTEGRNEEAIKSYEQAVQIADEVDHNDIKAKAYQHLGIVFTGTCEHKKAIEYYQKARKISPRLEGDEMEVIAYQRLGYNHLQAGLYKESIEYYKEAIKLASQLGDKKRSLTLNAYLGLGNAFSYTDDFEFSRKYFLKALTVAEQMNDKALQKEAYTNLGYVYYQSCKFDAAVKSYLKVQEISHDVGDRKEEASACLMLGDTFQELKRHKKATESYQTTLDISGELEDKEMQVVAIQRLATLFFTLASICSNDFDCDRAIEWYKKALDILGTEPSDHLLHEKALTGLGVAWFNLGDTEKAMESIHEAQNVAKNTDTDSHKVQTTREHINSTEQTGSASPVPGEYEDKKSENVVVFRESEPVITEERVDALIEKVCNPTRTEMLPNEDLVQIKETMKTFYAKYVYAHRASSKEPLTENVRKSMTKNVRSSAYANLLSPQSKDKRGRNDGQFVRGNQQILNFARDDLSKITSTKKPAILSLRLSQYIQSIGLILCGEKVGTCWLVTDMLVITCHHVYMSFMEERAHFNNPHLPIEVLFDYFEPGKPERIRKVEIDVEHDPQLESSHLDYKFLRLKECEALKDRKGLGPIVRNRLLHDGLVVIVGHPGGSEMCEEACVVVSNHSWREILKQRDEKCKRRNREFRQRHNADLQISPGVHMTNNDLLEIKKRAEIKRYQEQGCLPYDTTLFSGASGSPVFDLNGNIVAMHTQGYTLEVERGKYSLMEFGVQFNAICEHMRERNLLEQFFPNYNLEHHEERMDEG